MDSIATMPTMTRLRGSFCSPMDEHRCIEQIKGRRKYKDITRHPADPYDIPAGLAQQLMPHYSVTLTAQEQAAYNFAMEIPTKRGPAAASARAGRSTAAS